MVKAVPNHRIVGSGGSILGGGALTRDRVLSLVRDKANPGALQYYGTDSKGDKGWQAATELVAALNLQSGSSQEIGETITEEDVLGWVYPIGSYVIQESGVDPGVLFGFGTWSLVAIISAITA